MLKLFQDAYFRLTGDKGDEVYDESDTQQAQALVKAFLGPYPEFGFYSFPQDWGSTSLGFSGLGGQAQTRANTNVVIGDAKALVYFGQTFAYECKLTEAFYAALERRSMPSVAQRGRLK